MGRPLGGGKRREGKLSRAAWSAHDVWYATSERIRDEGVAGRRPPRPPNISSFCSDIVVCFFAVCPFLSLMTIAKNVADHFLLNSFLKPSTSEPWLPNPDFLDSGRRPELIHFLLKSFLKPSISEPWPPDPDFLDDGRRPEPIHFLFNSFLKPSI